MKNEIQPISKEHIHRETIRPLTPADYDQWVEVAKSAWGIEPINQIWDYDALTTDNIACLGLWQNDRLLGASINVLKIDETGKSYLLVHQLGVRTDVQDQGVGKKLLDADYALVNSGKLGAVDTIKLTSDPLVSRNVRLYLHKNRLTSSTYIREAYKGLEKVQGVRSDRLYYEVRPKSAWAAEGILPEVQIYVDLVNKNPEILDPASASPVQLVEVPYHLDALKKSDLDAALKWQNHIADVLPDLYSQGYTSVDQTIISDGDTLRSYIVCIQGYNENNAACLVNQLSAVIGRHL